MLFRERASTIVGISKWKLWFQQVWLVMCKFVDDPFGSLFLFCPTP